MVHTTVVFSGGPPPTVELVSSARRALAALADPPDLRVAADGGLQLARALGVDVDLVVGDLDSVDPVALEDAVASGVRVDRHPVDKDVTDLELALDAAVSAVPAGVPARVVVVGQRGGRLDHLLAAVAVLASPRWRGVELEAHLGGDRVLPVWGERRFTGRSGDLVTLLAAHGAADGVSTEGLKWQLVDEELQPGSGRGVSNELVQPGATVRVRAGCVVVVVPAGDDGAVEP